MSLSRRKFLISSTLVATSTMFHSRLLSAARAVAGIVCFEVNSLQPMEVVQRLLDRKIIASTTPYGIPYARLAAGIMNTPDEVDEVLKAVGSL